MALTHKLTDAEADRLYEEFGKPLEEHHWGEYAAISPSGGVVLAPTLLEAADRAERAFGPGNYLFRIGPRAVGRWR